LTIVAMTDVPTIDSPGRWAKVFENRFDLSLALSLLLLLLYPHNYWYIQTPLSVIALAALIFPPVRKSPFVWAVAAIIVSAGTYINWYTVDNHKYLLAYWCVAIFCALLTRDPELCAEKTAHWLIGLVFFFAVLQKTISDDYLNTTFFYYELLLDERFSGVAKYIGGVPDYMNTLNMAARRALVNYDSALNEVYLGGTRNLANLALIMTWCGYLIELIIGAAFLAPRSTWLSKWRNVWLLLFLFSTYLLAPVIGFGWVLAIMGIAQTGPEQKRFRALYVLAFLFLQIYRIPWGQLSDLLSKLNRF
jgi:hypothetical protein